MKKKTPLQKQLNTELVRAAKRGNIAEVDAAIEQGAQIDGYGYKIRFTALIAAIQANEVGVVQHLLNKGANPNATATAWSPLMYAAFDGFPKIVKILLDAGAAVSYKDSNQASPLQVAETQYGIYGVERGERYKKAAALLQQAELDKLAETKNNNDLMIL